MDLTKVAIDVIIALIKQYDTFG